MPTGRPQPSGILEQRTTELIQVTGDLVRREQEVVALNAQLVQRTVQLELAGKHKSDFLANMSHELRTPLNAIIGFSEVMLDHGMSDIPDEQRRTVLNHIQRSGHHLLGLVNDILDLSKVEAGHMELSLERVQLRAVIDSCVNVIRAILRCQAADPGYAV